jgi:hypothetical protein
MVADEGNVACSICRLRQVATSLQLVGNLVFTGGNKLFDVFYYSEVINFT